MKLIIFVPLVTGWIKSKINTQSVPLCVLTITNDSSKFLKSTIWKRFYGNQSTLLNINFAQIVHLLVSKENLINYIAIHSKIKASGLYNFQDCRIPVFSRLNISYIRQKLLNYSDYQVCDFLEYGWPVGHNGSSFRSSSCRNHTRATDFPEQITSYLIKEASYQAVVGPFKDNPFN